MITLNRTDRSRLAEWWWTADRWIIASVTLLMVMGVVFSLAASPAVAERLNYDAFHFVYRQMVFVGPALLVIVAVSLLSLKDVKRLAVAVYLGGLAMMLAAIWFGPEIKGAHRWLPLGPLAIQPSEFVKPAFTVLAAWMLSEARRNESPAALGACVLLYLCFVGLLIMQPDFGQTMLATIVWGALFFMAGMPLLWIMGLAVIALGGAAAAYALVPHVTSRVDRFLNPDQGDTYQIDNALDAFSSGGVLGVGPGEGQVKMILPDAHTDFIFAVIGEEYGLFACIALALVFCFFVVRALMRSAQCPDLFTQLASAGLAVMLGLQAAINMSVNLALMPAKGMTLPFVSYGGSSLLALALAVGFLVALTRRRPVVRRGRRLA